MTFCNRLLVAAFTGMAGITALDASALWLIPTGVTASSEQQANDKATKTIDASGLSAESVAGLHAAGPATSWSFRQGNSVNNNEEWITFDLGSLYNLTDLHIWQFTRTSHPTDGNRSVKQFDVSVSSDNVGFTEVISNAILNKAVNVSPPNDSLPDGDEPVQSFSLIQSGVRYVTIGIDSTYEGSNNDWQGGLGEVRFEGTLVPEPGSLALLGIGGLLVGYRRRRG